MENKFYIYLHVNPIKQEVFNVGRGEGNRVYSKQNRNKWWHNTVNKYGYTVAIIETNLTNSEANKKEIFYIKQIGRRDLGLGTLVNLTEGGEGSSGAKLSDETKSKMSEAQKGKKISKKTRELLKNLSHKKAVVMYSLVGKFLGEFISIREAEIITKISRVLISGCCNDRPSFLTAKGYVFRFKGEPFELKQQNFNEKPVIQKDNLRNIIKEYNSIIEAHQLTNVCRVGIGNCCKNKQNTAGGFMWEYKK